MAVKAAQLLYSVTVAREGQITRAARKLNIAQPALSQSIANLEADLGFELLTRHPRGVTLTQSGEVFFEKAQAALAAAADAEDTARSLARRRRVNCRSASSPARRCCTAPTCSPSSRAGTPR